MCEYIVRTRSWCLRGWGGCHPHATEHTSRTGSSNLRRRATSKGAPSQAGGTAITRLAIGADSPTPAPTHRNYEALRPRPRLLRLGLGLLCWRYVHETTLNTCVRAWLSALASCLGGALAGARAIAAPRASSTKMMDPTVVRHAKLEPSFDSFTQRARFLSTILF